MSDGEPRRAATIVGALALAGAMAAGIAAIQLLVDQSYRGAAIRLVAAVVLLLAIGRIRAFVRSAVEWPSAWEERAGETAGECTEGGAAARALLRHPDDADDGFEDLGEQRETGEDRQRAPADALEMRDPGVSRCERQQNPITR